MATPPRDSDENIKALEQLQAGAARGKAGRPPAPYPVAPPSPSSPPPIPLPPEHSAAPPAPPRDSRAGRRSHDDARREANASLDDDEPAAPPFRCLTCGYALLAESGYRCPECGRSYDVDTLESVFHGEEKERLTRLVWLVHLVLVLKLYLLPTMLGVNLGAFTGALTFLNALIVIAMCYMAGRDRQDTIGGYYAVAGTAAGCLCLLGLFRGICAGIPEPLLYALDAVAGCLLLLSLLTRPDGAELWRGRATRHLALTATIAIPPLVAIAYGVETALDASAGVARPAVFTYVNSTSLAAGLSIAVWLFVRRWLVGFRRNVLSPADG